MKIINIKKIVIIFLAALAAVSLLQGCRNAIEYSQDFQYNADLESEDEKSLVLRTIASMGERERTIMSMRFGLDGGREFTQKEVADRLGISQSYISRLEKRIIEKLKREIENV